jgi:hypothetical protein
MKQTVIAAALMLTSLASQADVLCVVSGYTRATGTQVASYTRMQTSCNNPASTSLSAAGKFLIVAGIGYMIYQGVKSHNEKKERELKEQCEFFGYSIDGKSCEAYPKAKLAGRFIVAVKHPNYEEIDYYAVKHHLITGAIDRMKDIFKNAESVTLTLKDVQMEEILEYVD